MKKGFYSFALRTPALASIKRSTAATNTTIVRNFHDSQFCQALPKPQTRPFRSTHGVPKNKPNAKPSVTEVDAFSSKILGKKSVPVFADKQYAIQELFAANQHNERSFMATDIGAVRRQCTRWTENLPAIRPFYAVKCNPDPVILETLFANGAGFDCATSAEIELALATGVKPDDIIFANPIKNTSDISYARAKGVKKMTFDNADELKKIAALFPEAELVLRLLPDDSGSLMRFGSKFGADEEAATQLLSLAQFLRLKVVGTSFHIGSGCYSPQKYDDALAMCKRVFDVAADLGHPMTFLDVGGGFPGGPAESDAPADPTKLPFEDFAAVIRQAVDHYFPAAEFPQLQKIGEPGRYMVSHSSVLFTKVTGKRILRSTNEEEQKKVLYYINDGVYGSFNCIIYDHYTPKPIPAAKYLNAPKKEEHQASEIFPSATNLYENYLSQNVQSMACFSTTVPSMTLGTFFGPTCDSMDKVVTDYPVSELNVGDWVVFENMGAYTSAAATRFNGCQLASINYYDSLA